MPLEWFASMDVFSTMGFDIWVDGQPIGGQVAGGEMQYWVDGQPVDREVDL